MKRSLAQLNRTKSQKLSLVSKGFIGQRLSRPEVPAAGVIDQDIEEPCFH